MEKNRPIFGKVAKTVNEYKNAKTIFTETQLESQKQQYRTTFETLKFTKTSFESDYLGLKCIKAS
jgi:hypothetical protein